MSLGRTLGRAVFRNRVRTAETGFTIIETLIVLAIAGLIMLVVFEAVPTLERNGRNDSRKQDVSTILQDVSHWELNNSGDFPKDNTYLNFSPGSLRYYTTGNIVRHPQTVSGASPIGPGSPNVDKVDIYNYELCSPGTANVATNTGAGYGDVVAIYAIETSGTGGAAKQCQQM